MKASDCDTGVNAKLQPVKCALAHRDTPTLVLSTTFPVTTETVPMQNSPQEKACVIPYYQLPFVNAGRTETPRIYTEEETHKEMCPESHLIVLQLHGAGKRDAQRRLITANRSHRAEIPHGSQHKI